MRRYFISVGIIAAIGIAVLLISPQPAGAFVVNADGVSKAATATNTIIEVKRLPHKGLPPGWSHCRKTGWHGRAKPPGQSQQRWRDRARSIGSVHARKREMGGPVVRRFFRCFPPGCGPPRYNLSAESVLQLETWPELKPLRNQRLRCSELPCVNESGTT
jgi:hypothetical protein